MDLDVSSLPTIPLEDEGGAYTYTLIPAGITIMYLLFMNV
jgi:hypothetical protein